MLNHLLFVTKIFISTGFSKNITNPGVLLFFLFYIWGTVHKNIVDQFFYFSSRLVACYLDVRKLTHYR